MTWKQTISTAAALGIFAYTNAGITPDGLWDGNDWYNDDAQVGVNKGVPYSNDADTSRRITSPIALEGDVSDYMNFDNVQRVMNLFSEADYDFVVPERNALYDYHGLLRAIGKFPAFCGESNLNGYTLDETCKRELAMLFAHFNQETGQHDTNNPLPEWRQGLWHITEWACTPPQQGVGTSSCDYKQAWGWAADAYPPQANVQYYGRGPFQLSWNYNYGAFSEVLVESSYNSRMYLLENPDQVHTDAFTVFTSALWFYMTPQSPKPSIHDVATGFMEPTAADQAAGFTAGFGVTTNIINGGQECGGGFENAKSQSRIDYYQEFLNFFNLPQEDESTMTCGNLSSGFPTGGYGDAVAYFDQGWDGTAKCNPVKWQTPYSIYTRDDYKRCICDYFGNGETDCPQAAGGSNDGGSNDGGSNDGSNNDGGSNDGGNNDGGSNDGGNNDGGNNGGGSVVDLTAEFQELYDYLDLVETKLGELHAIFQAHQLA